MDEYTPHYLNKSSNVPPVKVGSRREPSEDIVLACLDRRYFILGGRDVVGSISYHIAPLSLSRYAYAQLTSVIDLRSLVLTGGGCFM